MCTRPSVEEVAAELLKAALERIVGCDLSTVPRQGNETLLDAIAHAHDLLADLE